VCGVLPIVCEKLTFAHLFTELKSIAMKFLKKTAIAAGILFAFFACNNRLSDSKIKAEEISAKVAEDENKATGLDKPVPDTTPTPSQKQQIPTEIKAVQQPKFDWDKKIIKNASMNLEVKNYKSFNDLLYGSIRKFGGYIAQEEQNQTDYKIENVVTIKVPVDQFDDLVTVLTTGEQKLIEKRITSEDVTTQVVDTRSRMEAKKQVRLKYLDLLRDARNMGEILNVQREINGIQEDIEAANGRIEYLSHSAAYSTINLTYFQVVDASAKNSGEASYGTKIWRSFRVGWNWVGELLIGIISIWPLFFFGFACWFAYKKWIVVKTPKRNA
jgi:hypothetical protein